MACYDVDFHCLPLLVYGQAISPPSPHDEQGSTKYLFRVDLKPLDISSPSRQASTTLRIYRSYHVQGPPQTRAIFIIIRRDPLNTPYSYDSLLIIT
jgi:hypothetical protein